MNVQGQCSYNTTSHFFSLRDTCAVAVFLLKEKERNAGEVLKGSVCMSLLDACGSESVYRGDLFFKQI